MWIALINAVILLIKPLHKVMESNNIKKKRKKEEINFLHSYYQKKKKKETMEQFQQSQGCRKMHLTKRSTDAY